MSNHPISVTQLLCLLILASAHFINAKNIDRSDDSVEHLDAANGLRMLEDMMDRQNGCYWAGTAPSCRGSCPSNYVEKRKDKCGDGKCCWSGEKKYCCPKPSNGCYWDGTAPACEGRCPNGFKEISSSKTGEGNYCLTGYKKFCCPK